MTEHDSAVPERHKQKIVNFGREGEVLRRWQPFPQD
jgi:hypothetical protein